MSTDAGLQREHDRLMNERARLVLNGVDPGDLVMPLRPSSEIDAVTADILAGPDAALAAGILAAADALAGPPTQPADPAWAAEVIRQAYQAGAGLVRAQLAADQRGTLHATITRALDECADEPGHVRAMAVTDVVEPLIAELVAAARAETAERIAAAIEAAAWRIIESDRDTVLTGDMVLFSAARIARETG